MLDRNFIQQLKKACDGRSSGKDTIHDQDANRRLICEHGQRKPPGGLRIMHVSAELWAEVAGLFPRSQAITEAGP